MENAEKYKTLLKFGNIVSLVLIAKRPCCWVKDAANLLLYMMTTQDLLTYYDGK